MSPAVTLTAYIDHFIYRNADNGYGVADLVLTGQIPKDDIPQELSEEGRFTAVGTCTGLEEFINNGIGIDKRFYIENGQCKEATSE